MPTSPRSVAGPRLWLNLAIVYVVWGSTYFGIAVAIESIPPFLMAIARFVIAGTILIAWDLVRNPAARRLPTRRELVDSAIVGGLLLGIANGFVSWGELTVPSGIAAILVAMIPVWFALFGWLYFRDRLPLIVVLGVVIGFAGVGLLVWPAGDGANHLDPTGIAILIAAPIAWSHGSIYSARRAVLPKSAFTASGLQMLAGAAVAAVFSVLRGEPAGFDPATVTAESAIAVGYLVIFGSMVAFTAYGWLLKHAPLSLVGTYAYVNPVVAVALGTVFLHEAISVRTLIASVVIVVAVAMIVTARGRLTRATVAATPNGEDPDALAGADEDGPGEPDADERGRRAAFSALARPPRTSG